MLAYLATTNHKADSVPIETGKIYTLTNRKWAVYKDAVDVLKYHNYSSDLYLYEIEILSDCEECDKARWKEYSAKYSNISKLKVLRLVPREDHLKLFRLNTELEIKHLTNTYEDGEFKREKEFVKETNGLFLYRSKYVAWSDNSTKSHIYRETWIHDDNCNLRHYKEKADGNLRENTYDYNENGDLIAIHSDSLYHRTYEYDSNNNFIVEKYHEGSDINDPDVTKVVKRLEYDSDDRFISCKYNEKFLTYIKYETRKYVDNSVLITYHHGDTHKESSIVWE